MTNGNEQIQSKTSIEELIRRINNWNDYPVVNVLASYQELSERKLQTPDLLSVLVDIKLQKSLTEFCHANQFSKIEDFVESFRAFQDGADDSEKQDSPDEFGLCWV